MKSLNFANYYNFIYLYKNCLKHMKIKTKSKNKNNINNDQLESNYKREIGMGNSIILWYPSLGLSLFF